EPVQKAFVKVEGDDLDPVVESAVRQAEHAARHQTPLLFASPIAGFANPEEPWRARAQDLAEGYTLSVDCDRRPDEARQKLEDLLGPATVVVASGGQWFNPVTLKWEDKLHLHWRLRDPTCDQAGHDRLHEARKLAAELVGADTSATPIVHPFRWPGSWHRKEDDSPRLC